MQAYLLTQWPLGREGNKRWIWSCALCAGPYRVKEGLQLWLVVLVREMPNKTSQVRCRGAKKEREFRSASSPRMISKSWYGSSGLRNQCTSKTQIPTPQIANAGLPNCTDIGEHRRGLLCGFFS